MRRWIPLLSGVLLVLLLAAAAFQSAREQSTRALAAETSGETALPDNRDTELYRSVIARMETGESYYIAASELHRERSYPLFPYFTVRPPTLAFLSIGLGTAGLYILASLLLLSSIVIWLRALGDQNIAVRGAFVGLLALGGAATINPAGIALHEFWCGMLITISLGFMRDDQWRWRLLFAALALTVREFALAYVLVLGFTALIGKRWSEVAGAAAIIVLFGMGMALHYQAVEAVRLASDLQSPPWDGLRGPAALVSDISAVSWLRALPLPAAAILTFLPLIGWAYAPNRVTSLLWFVGFGATVAIFARPNNIYWVLVLLPAYLAGLAFLASRAMHNPAKPAQEQAPN